MKGKKKILIITTAIIVVIGIAFFIIKLFINKNNEVVYLKPVEERLLFKTPERYKGKYFSSPGLVYKVDENKVYAYTDFLKLDKAVVLDVEDISKIERNNFIIFDGKVVGKEDNNPFIKVEKIDKVSYSEALEAIKETVELNKEITLKEVTVKVEKVIFVNKTAEVYLTITNKSKNEFSLSNDDFEITQGKDITGLSTTKEIDFYSRVKARTKKSGTIKFTDIRREDFKLKVGDYSFNIEVK